MQRRAQRGHPGGVTRRRTDARGAAATEAEVAVVDGLHDYSFCLRGHVMRRARLLGQFPLKKT
jgi:hypothetical protein